MGKVLLITAEWRLRALVRAQLLEMGFDVLAWPALETALAHLVRGAVCVRVTILDLESAPVTAQTPSDLVRLTDDAPLLLVWAC